MGKSWKSPDALQREIRLSKMKPREKQEKFSEDDEEDIPAFWNQETLDMEENGDDTQQGRDS